jgi:hypothetical protein
VTISTDVQEEHRDLARTWGLYLTDEEALTAARFYEDHRPARAPHRLVRLHQDGRLTGDLATYLVPSVWRFRRDECDVPVDMWLRLFEATRYTSDFSVSRRPRFPLRLYRGATAANKKGLSWTTKLDQAIYFARSRQAPGAVAHIWIATVPARQLLAYLGGWEHEYVVDPRELTVRQFDPASAQGRREARLPATRLLLTGRSTAGSSEG